ncbi:MAG: putative phosphatase [Bacillota bacterium]|nr:putative phosphatase [Bacillota bacterium]MDK2926137.1 putative phosphatase [Bacillota bacterium]MDK2960484.1 putative phosphatase [Bacillota bacterium]
MAGKGYLQLFCPNLYLTSVYSLPEEDLKERGIRGLIFDLDNTILNWNAREVTPETRSLFSRLRAAGFRSCLVSNNKKDRVEAVARALGIPAISKAGKPRRRAFRQALTVLGTDKEETAVIGDQLFTDILGGNRFGLYTVLVVPLSGREFIGTHLMRWAERLLLGLLIRRGLIQKPAEYHPSAGRN